MKRRRPGLQGKWAYVVNSLQHIVPSYEKASSRISLFEDKRLRLEAVAAATEKGSLVLDLGAGPGTMSRIVSQLGGRPVLVDVSRKMLEASDFENRVLGAFENLPFRASAFDAVVSGFALRDSRDLLMAASEVHAVLKDGGRFSFCDLGKPDSSVRSLAVAYYLRVVPSIIGLMSTGRAGLGYGSIFQTYMLVPRNGSLRGILSRWFDIRVHETQLGASVVVSGTKAAGLA